MRHSDECRQVNMEAVEADDVGRKRTFLDKNVPRRPAPEMAGRGGAALAVAAPPPPAPVRPAAQEEPDPHRWKHKVR